MGARTNHQRLLMSTSILVLTASGLSACSYNASNDSHGLSKSEAVLLTAADIIDGVKASLETDPLKLDLTRIAKYQDVEIVVTDTWRHRLETDVVASINTSLEKDPLILDFAPVAEYQNVEILHTDTWQQRQNSVPDHVIVAHFAGQPEDLLEATDPETEELMGELEAALESNDAIAGALYIKDEDWTAEGIIADIKASLGDRGPAVNLTPVTYYADEPSNGTVNGNGRRRPGRPIKIGEENRVSPAEAGAVPPPSRFDLTGDPIPVPDRWRLASNLGLINHSLLNPYGQNTLKGDRPIKGFDDWFLAVSGISDTIIEPRTFPVPVGVQTTESPGRLDVFGDAYSFVAAQTFIAQAALIKGSTAYKPQDLEYRLTAAFNYNYVDINEKRILFVEPSKGSTRRDLWVGLQEAFIDYHIRNVSDRYDFDSLRFGIQPFNTDFRGFLFQDNQFGLRFFGNRDNNRWQYNLAAFARLEKDTNSGLNDVTKSIRDDYIFLANAYRQDFPFPGMTSQGTIVYNMNREKGQITIDDNGFPVRPALLGSLRGRDYDVTYLGYNADGRWKRLNLTASFYYALGENRNSIFTNQPADIRAYFAAVEPSLDFNWIRFRLSGLYASGDSDPYDDKEEGFDAIFENPQFAGADTSYWIRQTIPFAGGGRVIGVNGRNGVLNSLRSSKEQGQSNFANPGTVLLGAGADFDIAPPLRVTLNANHIWFDDTSTVEALRVQGDIDPAIGWDVSVATIYRPRFIQNFVFRLSGAALLPGQGFEDLFENKERDDYYYSILFNGTVTY